MYTKGININVISIPTHGMLADSPFALCIPRLLRNY